MCRHSMQTQVPGKSSGRWLRNLQGGQVMAKGTGELQGKVIDRSVGATGDQS